MTIFFVAVLLEEKKLITCRNIHTHFIVHKKIEWSVRIEELLLFFEGGQKFIKKGSKKVLNSNVTQFTQKSPQA